MQLSQPHAAFYRTPLSSIKQQTGTVAQFWCCKLISHMLLLPKGAAMKGSTSLGHQSSGSISKYNQNISSSLIFPLLIYFQKDPLKKRHPLPKCTLLSVLGSFQAMKSHSASREASILSNTITLLVLLNSSFPSQAGRCFVTKDLGDGLFPVWGKEFNSTERSKPV